MTTSGTKIHYRPAGLYGSACHPDTLWGHELHATDDITSVTCRFCLRTNVARMAVPASA